MVVSDVMYLTVLGLILLETIILAFAMEAMMRSHRLVVRSPESNRIIGSYLMRPYKDKEDKSIWWRSALWQRPVKLPEPPDEVINITARGKSWVDCWRTSEDEYVFAKPQHLDLNTTMDEGVEGEEKLKIRDLLRPFSKVQRQVVVQQFARADAMRRKSWFKENGMNIIAMTMMMTIIVMAIIFSGEIFQGINETLGTSNSILKDVASVSGEWKNTIQEFRGSSPSVIVKPDETPPR